MAKGRSRCDHCKRQLAWFEIVPLLGFVLARGRCRTCGGTIAPVQPLVEALCAISGAWFFAMDQPGLALLCWLLIALGIFDALHLWLPDRLVAALAGVALIVPGWDLRFGLATRIAAGAGGFLTLWLIARSFRRITGREGLGLGDAKLLGALGLWLGPAVLPQELLAACLLGLGDVALRYRRSADPRALQLPLGTYLATAAIGFAVVQSLAILG